MVLRQKPETLRETLQWVHNLNNAVKKRLENPTLLNRQRAKNTLLRAEKLAEQAKFYGIPTSDRFFSQIKQYDENHRWLMRLSVQAEDIFTLATRSNPPLWTLIRKIYPDYYKKNRS
jgi:hypothetical protein